MKPKRFTIELTVILPPTIKAPLEFLKALDEDLEAMCEAHTIEDYQIKLAEVGPIIVRLMDRGESDQGDC